MKNIPFPLIALRINALFDEDQAMRKANLSCSAVWDDTLDYHHAQELKPYIVSIGWPTFSKIGKEASRNLALIVRHADNDLSFQRWCLVLMKACPANEVECADIAHLEDRICVNCGEPQIYGTQFHEVEGEHVPRPIWNRRWVDARRKKMGLPPLEKGIAAMRRKYAGT